MKRLFVSLALLLGLCLPATTSLAASHVASGTRQAAQPTATGTPAATETPTTVPVAVDFSVDKVVIQSNQKPTGKKIKKPKAGAKAFVVIYWTLRSAPSDAKPAYAFVATLCKKKYKTSSFVGSRDSYPVGGYFAVFPIKLKKAGTYRFAAAVDVNGKQGARTTTVVVGGKKC